MELVLGTVIILALIMMTIGLIAGRQPRPQRVAAHDHKGRGVWVANMVGECCSCFHEWEPGELIGFVTQQYERDHDMRVRHSPGTRLACVLCVEWQRVDGDLSLRWAKRAGLL